MKVTTVIKNEHDKIEQDCVVKPQEGGSMAISPDWDV